MAQERESFLRTEFDHVWQRGSRFKLTNPRGVYEITVGSIEECKAYFNMKGWLWTKDRTKRQPTLETVENFSEYLKWRRCFQWDPADKEVQLEVRRKNPELIVASPCTYALGIEGKEGGFWHALLAEYTLLNQAERQKLLLLVSGVVRESEMASRIQYRIHSGALQRCGRKDARASRSWWAYEAQHNAGQRMGWLSKALSLKVLLKTATLLYSLEKWGTVMT